MSEERTAVYVGEGSDVSAEDFLGEVLSIIGIGKSFKFEKSTAADLRKNECYGEEDYSDSELEEASDMYITVIESD